MDIDIGDFKEVSIVFLVLDCPACGTEMSMEQLELESSEDMTCTHCGVTYDIC